MSKIKNGGLDQYGAKPFERRQFGTAGVEGVNTPKTTVVSITGTLLNASPIMLQVWISDIIIN